MPHHRLRLHPRRSQLDATTSARSGDLLPLISQGRIPVMGGFIASNADGITTTLGRGGSDYSASIFGAALSADSIEIWTDVKGVMTTVPAFAQPRRRSTSWARRGLRAGLLRRQGIAPLNPDSRHQKGHSRVRARLPASGRQGHLHPRARSAQPDHIPGYRRQERMSPSST